MRNPLGLGVAGQDEKPRGVHVQTVTSKEFGVESVQPRDQAIGLVGAAARGRQEAAGLYRNRQVVVQVDGRGRRSGGGW